MFVRYFTQIPPMTPVTRGKPTLRRKWRKPLWGQHEVSKCSTMRSQLKENLWEHNRNPNRNMSKFLTGTLQTRTIRSRSWGSLLQLHWLERRTSSLLMVCTRWLEIEGSAFNSTFNQCFSSSASPAMGLPCRILRSLPWGCCWSARQSLCSRGEKYWKLSERSTNNAQDFPDVAWARPTGVLNFPDCSPEGQGIPDLGLPNVRPSFCTLMQYNTLILP